MALDMWWNSDLINVSSVGGGLDVALHPFIPTMEYHISTLVAIRCLFARNNLEPKMVAIYLGNDDFMRYQDALKGVRADNKDGSFSWGGFVFFKG